MTGVRGFKRAKGVRLLSDEQLDGIHEASLRIMERSGLRFDSENARRHLLAAGCVAHPDRKDVITLPRSVVNHALLHVPRNPTYYARDPAWDVKYDGRTMFPYSGGGDPKMIDLGTGAVRPAMLEDVEAAATLGDALENCSYASSLVVPNEIPSEILAIKITEAMVKNSTKALTGYAPNPEAVDFIVKMLECVSGGEEEFRRKPLISLSGSPSSPLTYSQHVSDVLIRSLELGVPYTVVPCPVAGGSGPQTLAGSLALQNAEVLAGLVLMQTVDGGPATVYAGRVCLMDPRSGRDLWAIPEQGLATIAMIQLAGKYGMAADACGMTSEIPTWGVQMGLERMETILMPALGGAESVSGIGGGWEGASCLEMMVVDNEILNDIERLMRGIEVDEDHLALDIIEKVGPMGTFLSQPHTMDHLRKGEMRISDLWDKRTGERTSKEGTHDIREEARSRVRKILKEHTPEPLDRDVARDMDEVVRKASKALVG
jgi:trimethylamine--corrinoid protein Co-methyltransferase